MGFSQAVVTFWQKYVVFTGRARRSEYWWVMLFLVAVSIPVGFVDLVVFPDLTLAFGAGPVSFLYLIAIFLPGLSLQVRRFHDVGFSGWWVLLAFIPIAGSVFAIVVSVLDSQNGTNAYGESAKYPQPTV